MVTPTSQSPHLHILIIPTLMIISRTMILILMITKSWFKKEFKIPSLIIKVHRFSDQLMFTCWHSYNLLFLLFYHQPGLRDGGPIALLASWGHTSVKTNSLSFNKSWEETLCHLVTYIFFFQVFVEECLRIITNIFLIHPLIPPPDIFDTLLWKLSAVKFPLEQITFWFKSGNYQPGKPVKDLQDQGVFSFNFCPGELSNNAEQYWEILP